MKTFAVALVLSLWLLGAERALAADLPVPGGAPIPPSSYYPISPPVNWGGVYIGLNGGYGLGSSNWSNTKGSTGTFADNGGVVGGTLGVNYAGFGDGCCWVWRATSTGRARLAVLPAPSWGRACWALARPAKPGLIG
jgi:opacity protein-like surface antigen